MSNSVLLQTTARNDTLISSCLKDGGELVGPGCDTPNYVPDAFLFSVILFMCKAIEHVHVERL